MTIFRLSVDIDIPHNVQPLKHAGLMLLINKITMMQEVVSWDINEVKTASLAPLGTLLEEDVKKKYVNNSVAFGFETPL
jgi:mannitol-specific phosphotransferase system IIBC component